MKQPRRCPRCSGQCFHNGDEWSCLQCGWRPPVPAPLPYVQERPMPGRERNAISPPLTEQDRWLLAQE